MPLISFSDNFAMYDVTPVENLFLLEYMPYAPGDYVRVYLYGLMQCYHPSIDATVEGIARVLNMKPEKVLDAFRYWEQKGVVTGISVNPPAYRYNSLRVAAEDDRQAEEQAYQYKDFNNRLQAIFGSERLLHPQEFLKAMEWVEDLKLPADVVLLLVEHKAEMERERGRNLKFTFKALEKEAMKLADLNIRTEEDARRYFLRDTKRYLVARKVLAEYNFRRDPTVAEVELVGKWLSDWGFTEEDILRAQKETVRSANPSFAYLDGILANHRAAAGGLDKELGERQQIMDAVKQTLTAIGAQSAQVTPQQIVIYEEFLLDGFSPEVIQMAATQCGMQNKRTFESVARVLKRWKALNLMTPEAVNRYAKLREEAFGVLERAGVDKKPGEADVELIASWRERMPMEVILYAAECARGTQLPLKYVNRLLTEWEKKNVTDLEGAEKERAAHQAVPFSGAAGGKKELPAQQYQQREYKDEELDYLAVDLTQLIKGEGQ